MAKEQAKKEEKKPASPEEKEKRAKAAIAFAKKLWQEAGLPEIYLPAKFIIKEKEKMPSQEYHCGVSLKEDALTISEMALENDFPPMALVSNILSEMSGMLHYTDVSEGGQPYVETLHTLHEKYIDVYGIIVNPIYSSVVLGTWKSSWAGTDEASRRAMNALGLEPEGSTKKE